MSIVSLSNRLQVVGTSKTHRLSLVRIAEARRFIDPQFLNSPQYEAETLGALFGCRLIVKVEVLNPIRSFKARGAQYLASQIPAGSRLVCSTAGNFGQGVAVAARKYGHQLTVFSATDANPLKIERMRTLGATVCQVGKDPDETHDATQAHAWDTRATLVADGRESAIAEGAGTIAVELMRWPEPFDTVLVPVGDGSLISGVGRWIKAHAPNVRVVGVCSSRAPAMLRSWESGRVTLVAARETIADGLSISTPYAEALGDLDGVIDDIVLVDDPALVEGMRLAQRELAVVLEPSGAAGLAALATYRKRFQGQVVATILTGGNVTPEQLHDWLMAKFVEN